MNLIKSLLDSSIGVTVLAPEDEYSERLKSVGVGFSPIAIDSKRVNPLSEVFTLRDFLSAYRRDRPSIILHFTPKPNIYGSLAATMLGIPFINNIAGLGTAFIRGGLLGFVVSVLYRVSQRSAKVVFFQNRDDLRLFTESKLVLASQARLLPGSGVDLETFSAMPKVAGPSTRFLMMARAIADKGVVEFVEAAKRVRLDYPETQFCLLGDSDPGNPSAVSNEQLFEWQQEGVLEWHRKVDDVRPHIKMADCVVLPSYREGTPRSLLEGASMSRPLIAADTVGCREPVDDGVNGYLCKPRNVADLAEKMKQVVRQSGDERLAMALSGREKMENEYDEKLVIDQYRTLIGSLMGG